MAHTCEPFHSTLFEDCGSIQLKNIKHKESIVLLAQITEGNGMGSVTICRLFFQNTSSSLLALCPKNILFVPLFLVNRQHVAFLN